MVEYALRGPMVERSTLPLSVITPAFGRPEKLERALASVAAQEARPLEIILVDDGSSPPLAPAPSLIRGIEFRLIRHEQNRGPAAARNAGLLAARGDWLTFLDSDDFMLPGSLGARWEALQRTPTFHSGELVAYACGWQEIDGEDNRLGIRSPRESHALSDFASGCWFSPGSCVLMEKAPLLATGILQDEALRRFEDMDWFLALGIKGLALRTLPLVGIAIERRRKQDPAHSEQMARRILDKWRATWSGGAFVSRLQAYLDLECASAHHYAGNRLKALKFLSRSLLAYPRTTLQLSPGWERDPTRLR